MPGLIISDTIMLLLFVLAFVLIYLGGKKLIFQHRGRGLVAFGLLAALLAFCLGGADQLPESVKTRINDEGSGIRKWTEQLVSSVIPDESADTGGLFSLLPIPSDDGSGLVDGIREGIQNMDAVKTFFGGISEGTESVLGELERTDD